MRRGGGVEAAHSKSPPVMEVGDTSRRMQPITKREKGQALYRLHLFLGKVRQALKPEP